MCLDSKQSVEISKLTAWKLFAVHNGHLWSPFQFINHRADSTYPPNETIDCEPEGRFFYAFADFKPAFRLATVHYHSIWNFRSCDFRIVLPVTLEDVCFKGVFTEFSEDIQCMDAYHDAYMAKKITVHDAPEHRHHFIDAIWKRITFLSTQRWHQEEIQHLKDILEQVMNYNQVVI